MDKVVSIIVPCFNGEKFVDRCLRSIEIQEYSAIEIVVVNDGSTDQSEEKILSWKKKFEKQKRRLLYVKQENQGAGSAINQGLKYVSGAYLSLLDVDDEYLLGAISERVEYLENHRDISVVRSNGWIVNTKSKYPFVCEKVEKEKEDIFLPLLRGETNNWAGSYMVRTSALFQFYPDREIYKSRYGQNLQILLPLVYKSKCGFIDKPHMNYIRQEYSLTQTANSRDVFKKDIENAKGFRDIRIHMVNTIVKDSEKELLIKKIEGAYWRNIMTISLNNKNSSELENAYKKLQEYENATLDDKINYYSMISKTRFYLLRIIRKIRNTVLH